MPDAFISITTSPGPGAGSAKVRSSTLRLPRKTAPRMRLVLFPRFSAGAVEGHGGSRSPAFPLLRIDHFAEEVQLDRHVVGVLEEDLEQLRVREAAEVHLDLVLLDAAAHFIGIFREERDMVDRARAPGALGVLLQEEHVARLVRLLR